MRSVRVLVLLQFVWIFLMSPGSLKADLVTVNVLDGSGSGISGASVRYTSGGSWINVGLTVGGTISFDVPSLDFNKIAVAYNQGVLEKAKAQVIADAYTWQTESVMFELRDHAGSLIQEIPGGDLDQGGGFWQQQGYTGLDGFVPVELFARASAYTFRMSYNHASEMQYPAILDGIDNTVVFQTGRLTLDYDGQIRSNKGGSWWTFTGPSMELLPGTYPLYLDDGRFFDYTIGAGDDIIDDLNPVPLPGAVLLGGIGLSYASLRLRRGGT